MKSADNKESFRFLYFIQLLVAGTGKIHIVIQKITLSTHIVGLYDMYIYEKQCFIACHLLLFES